MPEDPVQEESRQSLSRRQLLKILAASGGAVAASTLLPSEWASPVVETGLLSAQAQLSPVPTEPPPPTATPIIYAITGCYAADIQTQEGLVWPWSTLETHATLAPISTAIQLRRRLVLLGTPDVVLDEYVGTADATGLFQPPDIDLTPFLLVGGELLEVRWTFVNPSEGNNSCINSIQVLLGE